MLTLKEQVMTCHSFIWSETLHPSESTATCRPLMFDIVYTISGGILPFFDLPRLTQQHERL